MQNVPIAPVNTPKTVMDDPQFADRFQWLPKEEYDADMLSFPVKWVGAPLLAPGPAPAIGEHTDVVLVVVAGYGEAPSVWTALWGEDRSGAIPR